MLELNPWCEPKAQAAIALKVPMSGIPELDDMIRESRRLDVATAAMRDTTTPEWCLLKADALLAASGKERGE